MVTSINLEIDSEQLAKQPQIVQEFYTTYRKLHTTMQTYMAHKSRVNQRGMWLDLWKHESCEARIGTGVDWATIYDIVSDDPGKGHATELLIEMKAHYEQQGKVFGSTVALNDAMKHLLTKLDIIEYL